MIHVVRDRDKAIQAGYESLKERIHCNPKDFAGLFHNFDMQAFCEDEIPIGMLITKGPELHVSIVPSYRKKWLSRRLINSVIDPIIKQYGHAITTVMKDNHTGINFVERLGFKKESENTDMIFYRKTNEDSHSHSH